MSDCNTLKTLTETETSRVAEILKLTKARMTALLIYFQPLYDKEGLRFENRPDITDRIVRWMNGDYTYPVMTYKSLFANLFFGKDNLAKAIAVWPRTMRAAVAKAVSSGFVSLTFLTALVRENPESWINRKGQNVPLSLDKLKSLFTTGISNSASYLSIDSCISEIVSNALTPQRTAIVSYDRLPEDGLTVFNGEAEIISLAPEILRSMRQKGIFIRSNAIPYAEKDVKYVSTTTGLKELFTVKPPKHLANFRTRAVMFILQMASSFQKKQQNTADMLRRYFSADFWTTYTHYVNVALPYLQKINMTATEGSSQKYIADIYRALLQLCEKNPISDSTGQWIDINGLVNQLGDRMAAKGRYGINISYLHFIHPRNTINDIEITPANAMGQFTRPLFYGCYLILAAVGLAEIAYDDNEADENFPFSQVRYIRLTQLGRYVFGFNKEYKPDFTLISNPPTVILDPDNLIIRTTTDAATATVRKLIGNKISSNRFVVNEYSVLAGVSTENDLKKKIDTLHALVKTDFPPLWETFFKTIAHKMGGIKAISTSDILFYEISSDNAELQRIIISDTRIRKLIRLVEDGAFIIRRNNFDELNDLLENYGYRLPAPVNDLSRYFRR